MSQAPTPPADLCKLPRAGGCPFLRLLLMLVIFASGGVGGYALNSYLREQRSEEARQHPELAVQRSAERMADRLDLSREEAEKLRQVMVERWPSYQKIQAKIMPEMRLQQEETRRRLVGVLRPEKLEKYDKYMEDMLNRWQGSTSQPVAAPATKPADSPPPNLTGG